MTLPFLCHSTYIPVDFYATWCGPCKMISPKFEAFAQKYTKATFIKVDVDEVPEVAEQASIRAMPTFHIYQNGEKIIEIVGADPSRLEAEIKKHAA
ncbi:thioredoxin, variant [Spizellomyces punctatus DAOM BR117]|uniref:Thioredoxin, variant n=1 Tax=Spizellomyces punctatus (strain DAOM BR117) TaxID=645134 RepID=A0A0L0HMM5_SPIPD|nr:thioredoxin, variant [Spizellomyces punctatus DAOM BR117]KND02352.1 thioredoxin, variant [Spizellomyces punctatus DAOM BR117]|eukprot:XP_016610391.1 thioredoxin, variant [Spizellomyces punctatus DAOM BR117]